MMPGDTQLALAGNEAKWVVGLAVSAVEGVVAAVGATAATAVGAFAVAMVAFSGTLNEDELRERQYVIRAGTATPANLITGTSLVTGYEPLTGFSVVTAPGMSVFELAQYAQFPNGKISYTTIENLASMGISVVPTPRDWDPLHATVVAPSPLSESLAAVYSGAFAAKMDNPFRGRGIRDLSVLGE
jgi:hypothetical protein